MAGRLTPLGFTLKWIVIPVGLGAIGYFLVGPRVKIPTEIESKVREAAGQTGKPGTMQASNSGQTGNGDEPNLEGDTPIKTFAEPEVDVTVTASNNRSRPKKKKRRRKPVVATPSQSEPSTPEPPTGDGGGAEPPPAGDGT